MTKPVRSIRGFQDLMAHRVQDILLVSSSYESFILSEDGQLEELILSQFLELNLHHPPDLTHISTGEGAIELALSQERYNLIITTIQVGDMDALALARKVKEAGLDVPGSMERRLRLRFRGRPGCSRRRGFYSILLFVSAPDLYRDRQALTAVDLRRTQPGAQDSSLASTAEDLAVRQLRGGVAILHATCGERTRDYFGR
jgi:CheY-like chemotaxis protein